MSGIDPRDERMFPKFSAREIDRLIRLGKVQRYVEDQPLFVTGEVAPGTFVLRSGHVRVTRRDPLGHLATIVEQGPGEFTAELGQLSGRPALVDAHAVDDVEALLIPSKNLRAVMIAEPECQWALKFTPNWSEPLGLDQRGRKADTLCGP